jgi:hypothetical protein
MSSAEAVLSNFGSDQWDAEVYAVVSMAARLSALVKEAIYSYNDRRSAPFSRACWLASAPLTTVRGAVFRQPGRSTALGSAK